MHTGVYDLLFIKSGRVDFDCEENAMKMCSENTVKSIAFGLREKVFDRS